MVQNKKENPDMPRGRYVWDPEKLAWVETAGMPTEEERIEEVTKEENDRVAEGITAEAALEEVVIAESAPIGVALPYQGALIRAAGAIIDVIIVGILNLIYDATLVRVVPHSLPTYVVPMIMGLLYFVGFWLWRGQTPGQMLINAKVIKVDGGPVNVGRAFLRYLFYLIPIYGPIPFLTNFTDSGPLKFLLNVGFPLVCLIVMIVNRQKRGIQDFIAGTVVIKSRFTVPPAEYVIDDQAEQANTSEPDTAE